MGGSGGVAYSRVGAYSKEDRLLSERGGRLLEGPGGGAGFSVKHLVISQLSVKI